MKIEKYISDLLYNIDCVVVPNFGGFILHTKDAIVNENLSVFKPPRKEVAFNSLLCNDDGVLISHISKKENISYDEAKNKVDSFVKSIKERLNIFEPVYLSKLGLFQMNEDKTLSFTSAVEINYNADSFGLSNFVLPAVNADYKNVSKTKTINLTAAKIVKSVASVAAILVVGFILFTVADYGLQNLHQASMLPPKQNPTEKTIPTEINLNNDFTDIAESISVIETDVNLSEEVIINQEEVFVDIDETTISSPVPVISEVEESLLPSPEQEENIVIKTISVGSDLLVTNSGIKHPFVIVASCPDYDCAKKETLKLHKKGYTNAAIINSGNRYRITISSEMSLEELDQTLEDAKNNIVATAWVHYF
ncbi:HU family DNA-binding protein [Bacteroidales bacterium OttesenSCG-928-K03]|nr:HU family DNA-binding protein [Bacteroidales bacterium OttesenSCG-928-K03]